MALITGSAESAPSPEVIATAARGAQHFHTGQEQAIHDAYRILTNHSGQITIEHTADLMRSLLFAAGEFQVDELHLKHSDLAKGYIENIRLSGPANAELLDTIIVYIKDVQAGREAELNLPTLDTLS